MSYTIGIDVGGTKVLGGVVDEETLIQMLESINEQTEAKSKVSFTRRRMDDDWD